ncbi:helix-turn-helix transcriptional regulator [Pseudonocardia alaniniphila]|uniref:AAA family ATPase n=1 Tax=Pseudonocardia alaniniphila TaxID=75291 RepID=A0ABS9TCJ7_9PSEU|nr:LuxR family transcriptional regulator [Pseudonocardia alaniniphila]MCH6166269.1 AAA family ATPase [Pseudonocardia alaniniphila]
MLRGRRAECEALERLLRAVRAGESRALAVCGEAGMGKTSLLEYVVERAPGCRVARAAGVQSEMELPFAGLHQLCAPMLGSLQRLPAPQRDALATAFGLSAGPAPDRFLVGLAVLGLLAEVAEQRPLICVIDDAHWLDHASAQALAFAARRLRAESVALLVAARTPEVTAEWSGLPQLVLTGLSDDEARALLKAAVPGVVDERILDRIVAETRGNPLALLELPRGMSPAELAGGFGSPRATAIPQQIEDSFRRQLTPLPVDTRELLLVAAAEPVGDPVLVWRAAQGLGITVAAAMPAAGLVELAAQVRFRHPLVRAAIYNAATPQERQDVHRALAEATDPEVEPDHRAWHKAQSAPGPDEDIAADLEQSAGRARARGGLAATAAFLTRAVELTPDPQRRAERALAAAKATHQAGSPDTALNLLSIAEAGPLDELARAHVLHVRGQIVFAQQRSRDASPLLLQAARRLEPLDVPLARETYLDALRAGRFAGSLGHGVSVREMAEAAAGAPPAPHPPQAADLLLDALAVRYTDGYAAAAPMTALALRAFRDAHICGEEGLHRFHLVCMIAMDLWDHETWHLLSRRLLRLAREAGALTTLHMALAARSLAHTYTGQLAEAAALAEEQETLTEATGRATGSRHESHSALMRVAWQGREAETAQLIDDITAEALKRGEGLSLTIAGWAQALLFNGLGRYEDALTTARQARQQTAEGAGGWEALVELIEAAARSGETDEAADALTLLSQMTRASGTDWALGVEARCCALLSTGHVAETAYLEATDRFARARIQGELARAHLVYGEWLRRERRRLDAREQLLTAHEMFTAMGMEAFAQRATRELQAAGGTARQRPVESHTELTTQEAQIARLVREGLTNNEISVRLIISPRTVEWHLGRIFSKLNITSRRQL